MIKINVAHYKRLHSSFDEDGRLVGKATVVIDFKKSRNFLIAILNSNLVNY